MSAFWKINVSKSKPYWLELEDPEGWRSAVVKADGCVDYRRYYNTPKGMDPENDRKMTDYLRAHSVAVPPSLQIEEKYTENE